MIMFSNFFHLFLKLFYQFKIFLVKQQSSFIFHIPKHFYVPFIWEEITVITENKKIQSRKDYFGTEGKLYEYLLELFKEEIPKEFFELRKVKKYEKVYTGPDHFDPNQKKD